jgi:hypothetical protein
MAIIYTYPIKTTSANRNDLILISDSADKNKTKQISVAKLPGGIDFVGVGGNGTAGKIPKWSTQYDLTDSSISEDSVTGNIGIGIQPNGFALATLDVSKNGLDTAQPIIRITQRRDNTSWPIAEMGRFEFFSSDGSGNSPYNLGYVGISNDYVGGTLPSGAMTFATTPYNATGGSEAAIERMRISSSGDVGIGTTSPDGLLHVSAGTQGDARLILEADTDNNDENDVPQIWFKADGGITEGLIGLNNNFLDIMSNSSIQNGIRFFTGSTSNTGTTDPYTGATEKMRILPNGAVGIGTSNPIATLDVAGSIRLTGTSISSGFGVGTVMTLFDNDSTRRNRIVLGANTSGAFINSTFNTGGTQNLILNSSAGNVGIGTTNPAVKLEVNGRAKITGANNFLITTRTSASNQANYIQFYDNTTAANEAYIGFTSSNKDLKFQNLDSAGTLTFSSGGAVAISVDASQKVGIGTTAPAAKLQVNGTDGTTQGIIGHSTQGLYIGASGVNVDLKSSGNSVGTFSFSTGNNERMRINTTGDVGIGEDNPTARLHVSKDNVPDGQYVCKLTSTSTVAQARVLTVQSAYNIAPGVVGDKMRVYSDGDVENINGAYGTIGSDERLKENIIDAKPKLNDILSLKVKNFNFIDNDKKQIGFIAQEFEKVFPSLVKSSDTRVYKTHDENGVLLEEQGELISGYEDTRSLRVGMEFAIITKVIQEQQEIIESLKQRIEQLEITK